MKRACGCLLLCLLLCMTGCNSAWKPGFLSPNASQEDKQEDSRLPNEEAGGGAQGAQNASGKGALGSLSPAGPADGLAAIGPTEGYAYQTLLTREEQQLYGEMYESLRTMAEETRLSTRNVQLLEPVFSCVMADHPELFYADGYTSTTYSLGDELVKIVFAGSYTMDAQTAAQRGQALEEALERCFADMAEGLDDYGKAKYLYEYIIGHTQYDLEAADGQNICSVLLNGRSVCQGYARAFQLLCQRQGLPSVAVSGTVRGEGHAWTLVCLDGDWYHVDPTWGDAAYLMDGEGAAQSSYPAVNYDYFCVTTEQITRTHTPDPGMTLPECSAVADQYYRREGLFLETADLDRVEEMIGRAMAQGEETLTFQCGDDAVYEQVHRLLIEEQKIFDYLPDSRAAYADSPGQRTITFWLSD